MGFRSRWLMLLTALILLSFVFVACSSGDDETDSPREQQTEATSDASGGGAAVEDDESAAMEAATEAEAAEEPAGGASGGEVAQVPSSEIADRLVIRNAEITMSVEDVAAALSWVRDVATKSGGYVFSTETTSSNDSEWAYITIRVPAGDFEAVLNQLAEGDLVREVESQRSSAEDVSGEFVDNEARLKALLRTEERYLELLGAANSIEDILRIESELTSIRTQIETLQGRQNYLKDATSYATISLTMRLPGAELRADDGTFVSRIASSAWESSSAALEVLLTILLTVGIVAVVIVPITAAFFYVARLGWRAAGGRIGRAG